MAKETLHTRIQLRNDTLANWIQQNPVLLKGEIAIAWDGPIARLKVGDGVSRWSDLRYNETAVASAETLGAIRVGENLTIDNDGVLSIDTSALRAYVDESILGGAS
jgi:hypothetical protein